MNFETHVQEDRRLVILRLLVEAHGFSVNSSILQSAMREFAHNVSRDLLHTELHWLAEQGLLKVEPRMSVLIATLTARGADVAKGTAVVPGVKRPGPGE